MRLKHLTLHGFKSFADRTEIKFHEGITAIVGPNGCGKSNISDAIRWVLGEQRASAIRSSKMEEAIFQGTTQRRAVNRAEVSLSFSNEDGRLPVPYDEIEIRRTVFREGGSDYEMNRSPCRLKDILEMCRDTGLGTNAYAIIEQGMVDAILSHRTEDRRQMFEEAAGIGRYKDRRKTARRRLESAEADLARLEDVIGEVETKVRSLARQRGRAQRYEKLRERRLSLEVAVASFEIEAVRETLEGVRTRLAAIEEEEPAARAELQAAETELERHRLEAGEVARERGSVGSRLEEVNRKIAEREREIAVAEERRTHARRRLEQIDTERGSLHGRIEELETRIEALHEERGAQQRETETIAERLETVEERRKTLRAVLEDAREADDAARERDEALARRLAELEADAAGADSRAGDLTSRLHRCEDERSEVQAELSTLEEQGDLFADRTRALAAQRAKVEEERDARAESLEALRAQEERARQELVAAEDRANRLRAQAAALEQLERDFAGFAPAVAELLAAREAFGGRLDPLTEFIRLPEERAAALENALGSLLQIVVVEDDAAVGSVREWTAGATEEEGTVALLPKTALPTIEALLDALEFVGDPASEPALIGRRERLETVRAEAEEASRERAARTRARDGLAEQVKHAEAALRELESRLQSVDLETRQMEADESARTGQRDRLRRTHDELEREKERLQRAREEAGRTAAEAEEERKRVEAERERHREARRETTRRRSTQEAAWEEVRDEDAELRVAHARAEGALAGIDRRLTGARDEIRESRARLEALAGEEAEHRSTLDQLENAHTDAGARLEELFSRRDQCAEELRALESRQAAAQTTANELESKARTFRRTMNEYGEERHRLELRRTESEAALRGTRERLEAEWGRPFEQLEDQAEPIENADDIEPVRGELHVVTADLERLGPVNMLAIEQHDEEKERLDFLNGQREDLTRAKEDLETAIREINRAARERFLGTFEEIRENFHDTFRALFEGGESDLWLADPDDPLESTIEISAAPSGKRTQRIHLLSGGERALTSLALLFAIYLVKPSPFCVLDEVDAPLDEANVERFLGMVRRFKVNTQFILITHNPRTIEEADWVYGVTMEDPGVSSIVGVQLDALPAEAGAASS